MFEAFMVLVEIEGCHQMKKGNINYQEILQITEVIPYQVSLIVVWTMFIGFFALIGSNPLLFIPLITIRSNIH